MELLSHLNDPFDFACLADAENLAGEYGLVPADGGAGDRCGTGIGDEHDAVS
jgi:hypothetical protein